MNDLIKPEMLRSMITETYFNPPIDDMKPPRCSIIFGEREFGWSMPYKFTVTNHDADAVVNDMVNQVASLLNKILTLAGNADVTVDQIRLGILHTEFWEYLTNPDCDPDDDCGDWRPERWCAIVTEYGAGNVMEYIDANPSRESMIERALESVVYTINTQSLKFARKVLDSN